MQENEINTESNDASDQSTTAIILNPEIIEKLNNLHHNVLRTGKVTIQDLKNAYKSQQQHNQQQQQISENGRLLSFLFIFTSFTANRPSFIYGIGFLIFIMTLTPIVCEIIQFLLGVRCLVPNNYLVWEATRPISDCNFCKNVYEPLILKNLTRDDFAPFAYSSQPIIIKNAVSHWPAIKLLNFTYLKNLYENIPGALDEECQFLHFRSEFMSLRDVFQKISNNNENLKFPNHDYNDDNDNGKQKPWYVGWSNCHPVVLDELRKLYPRPHFLPEDAEMPNTDYIFLGYEQGAIMHLDYIPRLMWQAQLQGNKSWVLAPTPECDHICSSFSFDVEPGDAVLVDTRIWYHGTSIPKGQFSLTIQSEYG